MMQTFTTLVNNFKKLNEDLQMELVYPVFYFNPDELEYPVFHCIHKTGDDAIAYIQEHIKSAHPNDSFAEDPTDEIPKGGYVVVKLGIAEHFDDKNPNVIFVLKKN